MERNVNMKVGVNLKGWSRDEAASEEEQVCCLIFGVCEAGGVAFRNLSAIDCVNTSEKDTQEVKGH